MNTLLPKERELPPYRHAQLRAELVRAISGPAPKDRRWLVPALSAAGLTVLASVALVAWQPREDADTPAPGNPPAASTGVATTTSSPARPGPVIPGLSESGRDVIEFG